MDYFTCECCDTKTHFEDSYQSITGDTLGEGGITFPNPETGKSYTTSEDCVCIPCGYKHATDTHSQEDPDTYSASFPKTMTLTELNREFKKHGYTIDDLFEEHSFLRDAQEFNSSFILGWMGY